MFRITILSIFRSLMYNQFPKTKIDFTSFNNTTVIYPPYFVLMHVMGLSYESQLVYYIL